MAGPVWMNAGSDAFVLASAGSELLGVVYWDDDHGWMIIHADDPENHVGLGEEDRADQQSALDLAQTSFVRRRVERGPEDRRRVD